MSSALYRMGRFAARRPWVVIGAWAMAAVMVVAASGAFGRDLEDTFEVPGLDSAEAADLLEEAGSDRAGITARVVMTPLAQGASLAESAELQAAVADVRVELDGLSNVVGVADPAVSADGRVAVVVVQYPVLEDLNAADLDELKGVIAEAEAGSPLAIEAGGDLFFNFEEGGQGTAELIGLVAAAVILLVAFGSVIAMGLPIGMALFGLALGISAMTLINYLIAIPAWAPQMASMIGLGVGIDYALFLVTRHRELLARDLPVDEAAGRAVATSGQAVIFAGATVVVAILGLAVAGVPFMTAAAVATSVIVGIMVVA
ncbi:MAG: MMPL family transporter, partial [Acidimicrobiia bacterium]|nr:MMPL family transporter [Acidimicrobiia bacterium]